MRFLGGPGMFSSTSFASLDFLVMTSLSRTAVCMRLTSMWFLTEQTFGHFRFRLHVGYVIFQLIQYIKNIFTYRFSHSLQQHSGEEITLIGDIRSIHSWCKACMNEAWINVCMYVCMHSFFMSCVISAACSFCSFHVTHGFMLKRSLLPSRLVDERVRPLSGLLPCVQEAGPPPGWAGHVRLIGLVGVEAFLLWNCLSCFGLGAIADWERWCDIVTGGKRVKVSLWRPVTCCISLSITGRLSAVLILALIFAT